MKWVKTLNGNIIRLGAISEFIPDGCKMTILIGETKEIAYKYDFAEQADAVYKDLLAFIQNAEMDNNIFSFPQNDSNLWLKQYSIKCLELSSREYNACMRSSVTTVYDLLGDDTGWKKIIRGIGKVGNESIQEKLDQFLQNISQKNQNE